jgi:hypothetical protein
MIFSIWSELKNFHQGFCHCPAVPMKNLVEKEMGLNQPYISLTYCTQDSDSERKLTWKIAFLQNVAFRAYLHPQELLDLNR